MRLYFYNEWRKEKMLRKKFGVIAFLMVFMFTSLFSTTLTAHACEDDNHRWKVVKKFTCYDGKTSKCTVCGATKTTNEGHKWKKWQKPTKAIKKCYPTATRFRKCTSCGDIEVKKGSKKLEQRAHKNAKLTWKTLRKATCGQNGYKIHRCSKCGDVSEAKEITANEHQWGKYYKVTSATCTSDSLWKRCCKKCGFSSALVTCEKANGYSDQREHVSIIWYEEEVDENGNVNTTEHEKCKYCGISLD